MKIFSLLFVLLFFTACNNDTLSQTPTSIPTQIDKKTSYIQAFFSKQNNDIEQKIIQDINEANSSITMAIYQMSNYNIYEALINAKNKGIKISILTDDVEFNKTEQNLFDELKKEGINIVTDSNQRALMHNKIIIIDKKIVWFGSGNLSYHAFKQNYEDFLKVKNRKIALFFDSKIKDFIKNSPNNSYYQSQNFISYFTPSQKAHNAIINALNNAKSKITLFALLLTDKDIANALIDAKNRGVDIKCILDSQEKNDPYSQANTLIKNGIFVAYLGDANHKFHNKIILIDEKTVITGSYNFSKSAYTKNFENIEFISEPIVIQKFINYAQYIFNNL